MAAVDELNELAEEVEEDDDVVESASVFMDGLMCVEVRFESEDELVRWRDERDLSFTDELHRNANDDTVLYVCIEE